MLPRHPAPGAGAGTTDRPESDATELSAYCDSCDEVSRFVRDNVDVSQDESASPAPDIRQALTGEPGWVCAQCGTFRTDPLDEIAYQYAYEHETGMVTTPFPDDVDTNQEIASEGVMPPERIHGRTIVRRDGRRVVDDTPLKGPRRPPGT